MEITDEKTSRLECALSMLPRCDTLIDVGCDHGRLCRMALTEHLAKSVVALDISADSLAKARLLLGESCQNVHFELRDGIAGLELSGSGRYCIAICGMGGELISSILSHGMAEAKYALSIVMQPMGGERELREWLFANGYAVKDENTVADGGRCYQLISVSYAPDETAPYIADAFFEFGSIAFNKRQDALQNLVQRLYMSRKARMNKAKMLGVAPPSLKRDLDAAQYILEHWEDKNETE